MQSASFLDIRLLDCLVQFFQVTKTPQLLEFIFKVRLSVSFPSFFSLLYHTLFVCFCCVCLSSASDSQVKMRIHSLILIFWFLILLHSSNGKDFKSFKEQPSECQFLHKSLVPLGCRDREAFNQGFILSNLTESCSWIRETNQGAIYSLVFTL